MWGLQYGCRSCWTRRKYHSGRHDQVLSFDHPENVYFYISWVSLFSTSLCFFSDEFLVLNFQPLFLHSVYHTYATKCDQLHTCVHNVVSERSTTTSCTISRACHCTLRAYTVTSKRVTAETVSTVLYSCVQISLSTHMTPSSRWFSWRFIRPPRWPLWSWFSGKYPIYHHMHAYNRAAVW